MRDKFTELIEKGVARFDYTPITGELPNIDPISRAYNNSFGMATDTHMSITANGTRIITGPMVKSENWERFMTHPNWCHINFKKASGAWCLAEFLYINNLRGQIAQLNGDTVYRLDDIIDTQVAAGLPAPATYTTSESKIPHPIKELVVDGDVIKFQECFNSDNIIKSLNESAYVRGNQWTVSGDKIIGLFEETVVFLNK